MSVNPLFMLGVPLGVQARYGTLDDVLGVWGAGLPACEISGLVYNATGKYLELLDDVWRQDEELDVWESATIARLDFAASERIALLWKNGVLINDDEWGWLDDTHIELLADTYSVGDMWVISYEQKKEIITPGLYRGVVPLNKQAIVDGYIFQKFEGSLREFVVEERLVFNSSYRATLNVARCVKRRGTLTTRLGRVIVGWSFIDDTTVQIEPYEYKAADEYIIAYTGVWDWLDITGIEVYYATKDVGSWSSYQLINFGDVVDRHENYQIKIVFRSNIKAGDIRVRSIVLKVL